MLETDQLRYEVNKYQQPVSSLVESLHVDRLKLRQDELERKQMEPGFWDDPDNSSKIVQEAGSVKNRIDQIQDMQQAYEDTVTMLDMADEENDASMIADIREQFEDFKKRYEQLRLSTLLTEEFDRNNAIVSLHPGAGGTEACDWTGMLYRMYTRWAERHGYKVDVLDYEEGDEAGIKSVTMQINGENAYGYLRSEKGVHRLVRISPFDANARRHTSFASCDVMPELDKSIQVDIDPDDIRIDVYRSSGAGGQKVNKTSTAIRITHIPTGIVVQCQNERSQYQNKDKAFELLRAKLYQVEQEKQMERLSGIRGEVKENAFGSQIRSYVFHPYTLVKDLRTDEETSNIQAVMDGDLDNFMNAYLAWFANQKEQQKEQS